MEDLAALSQSAVLHGGDYLETTPRLQASWLDGQGIMLWWKLAASIPFRSLHLQS
jgi:hypothetical protein